MKDTQVNEGNIGTTEKGESRYGVATRYFDMAKYQEAVTANAAVGKPPFTLKVPAEVLEQVTNSVAITDISMGKHPADIEEILKKVPPLLEKDKKRIQEYIEGVDTKLVQYILQGGKVEP